MQLETNKWSLYIGFALLVLLSENQSCDLRACKVRN